MTVYKIWISASTGSSLHLNGSSVITRNSRPYIHSPLWIKRVVNSNGVEEIVNCYGYEATEFYHRSEALAAIYRFKLIKGSEHLIMDAVKFSLTISPKRKSRKTKGIRKIEDEMRRLDIEL